MFKGRYHTYSEDIVAVHEIDKDYQGEMKEGAMYWGHQVVLPSSNNLSPQIPKRFWLWNEKGDCVYHTMEGVQEIKGNLPMHGLSRKVNQQSNLTEVEIAGCMACTKDKKEREELLAKRKSQYTTNPELLQVASPANPIPTVDAHGSPLDMLEDTANRVAALREHIEQFMRDREIVIGDIHAKEVFTISYSRLLDIGRLINAIRSNPHG